MNLLGLLSLVWQCVKLVVGNETVNHAMDNWTKGTSNQIDDAVWKLLEQATGVADETERKAMLDDGLKAIEEKYADAKAAGALATLKAATKTWEPATRESLQVAMLEGPSPYDNVG